MSILYSIIILILVEYCGCPGQACAIIISLLSATLFPPRAFLPLHLFLCYYAPCSFVGLLIDLCSNVTCSYGHLFHSPMFFPKLIHVYVFVPYSLSPAFIFLWSMFPIPRLYVPMFHVPVHFLRLVKKYWGRKPKYWRERKGSITDEYIDVPGRIIGARARVSPLQSLRLCSCVLIDRWCMEFDRATAFLYVHHSVADYIT